MVGVELSYTDQGTDDKASPYDVTVKAVGPRNTSYNAFDTSASPPNRLDISTDIFKGGTVRGNLLFTIDTSDAEQLIIYANGGYGNTERYFATNLTQAPPDVVALPTSSSPVTVGKIGGVGTRTNPVGLGSTISIGDGWTMKLVSYSPNTDEQIQAADKYNDLPPAGKQYSMIGLELSYGDLGKDDKAQPYDVTLKAVGPSKVSYSWSDTYVSPPNELDMSTEVFKGGTVAGNRVFTVSAEDADALVIYAVAGYSNKEIYFSTT